MDHCIQIGMTQSEMSTQFRTLQVLATLMNEIQKDMMIPCITLCAIPAVSISMVMVVRTPPTNGQILESVTVFFGLFEVVFILLVIFGAMAQVIKQSETTFQELKRHLSECKNQTRLEVHWKRKFYRSCNNIKVKLGSINFIDRLTPLNCVNMANDFTVQLLLCSN